MNIAFEELKRIISLEEDEHYEFKEAKDQFDSTKLTRYCVALANEGGGCLVLGVTDKRPRKIVGTSAFRPISTVRNQLLDRLHLRIDVEEIDHPDGRVVVFNIPARPLGRPIEYKGAYWMRSGESLVPMTPEQLHKIFNETGPDFSSQICTNAKLDDLNLEAIEVFREKWMRQSGNQKLNALSPEQLLEDAELIVDGHITYAALIMFGTYRGLGKHLAQSEIIFEYRSSESSTSYQQRKEFREGFFLIFDELWSMINLRNEVHDYQDGLFRWKIPSFNESVIREAILNAVSHRDYRLEGSVFVKQYPKKVEFISPGGFPPGITPENILWRQSPRNRRIAEAFSKCGLVERSGQGANRMFEQCVKESKNPPQFEGTDDYQVYLTLHGEVRDPLFLKFLERLGQKTQESFDTRDFIILDLINREKKLPDWSKSRLLKLRKTGVIERAGSKYILSQQYYEFIDKKGVYTRKRGLDRNTNKLLLLKHIKDNKKQGSRLRDLMDVLPALTRNQVQKLILEMKNEGMIYVEGKTRSAKWYPGSNER